MAFIIELSKTNSGLKIIVVRDIRTGRILMTTDTINDVTDFINDKFESTNETEN